MRRFLISAAALALLAAPAWADPPSDRGNRGHEGREAHGGPPGQMGREDRGRGPAPQAATPAQNRGPERENRGPAPQMAVQAPQNRGGQNGDFNRGARGPAENRAPQMAVQAPPNRDQTRDFNRGETRDVNRGDRYRGQMAVQAPPSRGENFGRTEPNRQGGFERRGPDNRSAFNDRAGQRHDFRSFRDFHRDFRATQRFRAPSYRRPSGWYSHRWAFGEFLPAAFWIRDYWLVDFADYDLPPPPYGAIWVRVDRDALLIDEDSGEIITVVYDVFY